MLHWAGLSHVIQLRRVRNKTPQAVRSAGLTVRGSHGHSLIARTASNQPSGGSNRAAILS